MISVLKTMIFKKVRNLLRFLFACDDNKRIISNEVNALFLFIALCVSSG